MTDRCHERAEAANADLRCTKDAGHDGWHTAHLGDLAVSWSVQRLFLADDEPQQARR